LRPLEPSHIKKEPQSRRIPVTNGIKVSLDGSQTKKQIFFMIFFNHGKKVRMIRNDLGASKGIQDLTKKSGCMPIKKRSKTTGSNFLSLREYRPQFKLPTILPVR